MNSLSKGKIAAGYAVLLAVLLFSLFFVYREMERLMTSDDRDILRTDSLITLLREKDENTVRLLRTLSETNDNVISAQEIEQIIAEQDTAVTQQRVQRRVTVHRDTIVTPQKKKGFFRRLGEVFAPSKKDSSIQVKSSLEFATDTVLGAYNPADSLHEKLRTVAKQKKTGNKVVQSRKQTLQKVDHNLTARIDSLLKGYEEEALDRARSEAEYQQGIRHRSATIIGSIAIGAVLLSVLFLVFIWRDITRSNRYRRELEEANQRAEELLAAREKLMLAITHDFKAPLGSIMGYADLLSRLTVDERQSFYLNNMKVSSEHLLKLVSDLLDFHRLDLHKAEINRVTFYPVRLLDEIRVSFEPLTAAKGLWLRCDISSDLEGTFISDPLRLRQLINNLLSNAVKFTGKGGVTLSASYEAKQLVVSVSDTGKGMAPTDCERIFQEFTRLPGAQGEEGFGLGLSIVRMLVQLLEGTIQVESALGEGSTFTLRVPLFPVATSDGNCQTEESSASPVNQSSLRILLIDDDRIQLTLTAAMLSQSNINSVCCQQLDELLEALRNNEFDVLLTDVQMPAINGFDLLKLLRASNIPQAMSIPVIAVTARSDMKEDDFLHHGFVGCLRKPFAVNELLDKLRAILPSLPESSLNLTALTAFSEDDPEAAKSIIESFVSETRLNVERMRQSLDHSDPEGITAMAHKMLPLFTLIGAMELVDLLKELEMSRGLPYSEEIAEKTITAIALIEEVIAKVLILQ